MAKSELTARVTVTCKPDAETVRKIEDFIKKHGCDNAEYVIDESIIGGIIIQIGDVMYDGSVKGRLGNIRQSL